MKKLLVIGSVFILTTLVVLGVAGWLLTKPMSWYAPSVESDPEISILANKAESRLNEEFHKIRPQDETWNLRIQDYAVNAWLSTRLEGWLTHDETLEIPPEFSNPFIKTTSSGIWAACMVQFDEKKQPVAIQFHPSVTNEGQFMLTPIAVRLGRIPLPISLFGEMAEDLQQHIAGVNAVIELMDDRKVVIQSITLEENAFVLSCQTHLP